MGAEKQSESIRSSAPPWPAMMVPSSDVLQYLWGKLAGRTPIAARISPNKTWEGLIGGVLTSSAIGTALCRATPFQPWQAAAICAAITLIGFAGGLSMSAIKRESGVKVGRAPPWDRGSACRAARSF